MGVAIENATALSKTFGEQQDNISRALKHDSMRVSQLEGLQYSISYLMATSASGSGKTDVGAAPLDLLVNLNLDIGSTRCGE